MTRRQVFLALVLGSLAAACDSNDEPPPTTVVDQQPQRPPDDDLRTSRPPPIVTGAYNSRASNPDGAPGGWAGTSSNRY